MAAIKKHITETVNKLWDWRQVLLSIPDGKDFDYYSNVFAWNKTESDLSLKDSYRFLHHEIEDENPGAANIQGCWGCLSALNSGNCPAPIEEDKQGVYDHITQHLTDGGIEDIPALRNQIMPIPKPQQEETHSDFMQRCMGDETMKKEYPEQDQRTAICLSSWRREKGEPEPEPGQNKFLGYSIKAQSLEAEVWLYDEIGSGWFGGVSAKKFADDLNKLGKIQNINVRLNSPGGDVFEGLAIYNILKQHSARVIMNIDGIAASIASVIAMAGDEIHIAENAFMMIHDPWTIAMGNATEMRKTADRLEKVSSSISGTYAKRTKKSESEIAEMMAKETWMTGGEALEMGFADSITETLQMAACFDLNKYKFRYNPFAAKATEAEIAKPLEADAPGGGEPMLPEAEPKKLNLDMFDRGIERCQKILERGQKK